MSLTPAQIRDAADVLLTLHEEASKKPLIDLTEIERVGRQMGRNRLRRLRDLASRKDAVTPTPIAEAEE